LWIDGKLCRLCLVSSRLSDVYRLNMDSEAPRFLRELSELLEEQSRTEAFTRSFNLVKRMAKSRDPYAGYKRELWTLGWRIARRVEGYLKATGWRLDEALRLAAAANIIDTSVLGYEPVDLEKAIWDRPWIEEIPEIPRGEIVYIAVDNAGEAAVDMVLAEALRANGYEVKLAVRSETYEIDVTWEELESTAEVEVVKTPGNKPPVLYLNEGFIIAKGIANLEAYLEDEGVKETLHLLRAKCNVIAAMFEVPRNAPIIATGRTIRELLSTYKRINRQ